MVERRCSGLGRVAAAVGSWADREAVVRRAVKSGMRRWGREGEGMGGRGGRRVESREWRVESGEWRVVEGGLLHAWDRRGTLFGVGS
jgi:hypothetical protein